MGVGCTMALNDVIVLMYADLTPKQISDWTAVIDHFCPDNKGEDSDYKYWGANRAWRAMVHAVRAIVGNNDEKLQLSRDGLSDLSDGHNGKRSLFKYVTTGDGFYEDGSFIQHFATAYTGGYGKALLGCIADVLYILHDTPFEVKDPESAHVYDWVYNAFAPLIYKHGEFMDMVRGREISRHGVTDVKAGITAIAAIIRLSQLAPQLHRQRLQSMVKYWLSHIENFYSNVSVEMIYLAKNIMQDAFIKPMEEPVLNKVFAGMDRAVHLRKGWGFGISMNSARQSYYETHTFNYENGKGYYTAEGMTYLYLSDPKQYSDAFWPTVNSSRLPGTTEDAGLVRGDASGYSWNPLTYSSKTWVGGASDGVHGVVGMEQDAWGATLTSKKSWFLFDDEVVCLGAGITSTDNRPIHTLIENRKLNKRGDNKLTVDGRTDTSAASETQTFKVPEWMHLAGTAAGSDIGYYFPDSGNVKALREKRSGKWSAINRYNFPASDPTYTNYFQELYLDHGANPTNAMYAYVLLLNKSIAGVKEYAAKPDIIIIENSENVQAVKESKINTMGINFWKDTITTVSVNNKKAYITSNKKAGVLLTQKGSQLTVAVSDPTQINTEAISIEIKQSAAGIINADKEIIVEQLSPTLKLKVRTDKTYGKSLKASFRIKTTNPV